MYPVYEELLGHMKENAVIGEFLQEETYPQWDEIYKGGRFLMLSSGEQVLVNVGLALYNQNRDARLADLFKIDRTNQQRVLNALSLRLKEWHG